MNCQTWICLKKVSRKCTSMIVYYKNFVRQINSFKWYHICNSNMFSEGLMNLLFCQLHLSLGLSLQTDGLQIQRNLLLGTSLTVGFPKRIWSQKSRVLRCIFSIFRWSNYVVEEQMLINWRVLLY